jgi:hypothetical protein
MFNGCSYNNAIKLSDYYTITNIGEYEQKIEIRNKKEELVHSYTGYREIIEELLPDCLKIINSTGSTSNYVQIYNINLDKMSDQYFNVAWIDNEKVVYAEKNKIIIKGVFDDYYKEYKREFSSGAVPSTVILNAYIYDNILDITYLVGDDYVEFNEKIQL